MVVITGLLASIALPRFADAQQRYRLRLAGQRVLADLQLAQSHARLAGASHTVSFDTSNNVYQLNDVDSLDRPNEAYRVDLAASPYTLNLKAVEFEGDDNTLTFSGYGQPDRSGKLILAAGASTLTVTIDAASGEIYLP